MGIILGIAVFMMEAVKNGIATGIQIRRSLGNKCEQMEKPLPEFIHGEHLVGAVAVEEKGLGKQG